jgi:hypothetical protein
MPNRLTFFLCPQTPVYEERAFYECENNPSLSQTKLGGMGGAASVTNEPQAHWFQASEAHHRKQNSRSAHVFMRGAACKSPRALSTCPRANHRVPCPNTTLPNALVQGNTSAQPIKEGDKAALDLADDLSGKYEQYPMAQGLQEMQTIMPTGWLHGVPFHKCMRDCMEAAGCYQGQ